MTPPCCEVWNCSDPTAFDCLAFEPPPRMPPMGHLAHCRKRIEDPHRTPGQLTLRCIGINNPGTVPGMDKAWPADNDCAMGKAAPEFEHGNIARLRALATRRFARRRSPARRNIS